MPDILDFNPNRDLSFDSDRQLGFDPGRKVGFDPNRDLMFNPGRDLGFGKRGPIFRGYVCPICGAAVTADQPSCTECGAVFEPKGIAKGRAAAGPPPEDVRTPPAAAVPPQAPVAHAPPPPPTRSYPPPPKRIDVHPCAYCGARVSATDAFCWNCGNRMYAGPGR